MTRSAEPSTRLARASIAFAMYDLFGVVVTAAGIMALPFLLATRRAANLQERFGKLPRSVLALDQPIWIHAASVGEVLAAEPLVFELRKRHPEIPLLVSTTSLTGRATALDRLGADAVMLLPADIAWIVDRTLRRVTPRCLIIIETEIWPALLRAASRFGVPVIFASGCISSRSARRYRWAGSLLRAVLALPRQFMMQTAEDANRIIQLGAPPEHVSVVGSLKSARRGSVATEGDSHAVREAKLAGRLLVVAASTHPGEEALVLDACNTLRAQYPNLLLLLAPRRPERFDEVAALLEQRKVPFVRRSALHGEVPQEIQVFLLDSVGELQDWFPEAIAVFVGGTVAEGIGGHNVLEPALFGKPVAFGPHTKNVAQTAAALLAAGGASLVHSAEELTIEWERLLSTPEVRERMGRAGQAVVAAQASVARDIVDRVCSVLSLQ